MERLKLLFSKLPKNVKKFCKRNTLSIITCTYMAILFLIVLSLYALCAFDFANGKAVFANLAILLDKCTSATFVAAVAFIGTGFVDSDGDGISDAYDKHHDAPETKQEPHRRERNQNE